MKLYIKIIYGILIAVLVFTLIWGINIVPKQISFDNSCKNSCSSKGLDYEIEIFSYPWNNVNGKCFCKNLTQINNFNGVSQND